MNSGPNELATRARIIRAALDGFVSAGVAVPSIRSIAQSAGVSTGSIQHFFPSQAALRQAVTDYVIALVTQAFAHPVSGSSATQVGSELGHRLTEFFHSHPVESRYLARTLIDEDDTASALFTALLNLSTSQWTQLSADGLLREDVDALWAALHVVIVNVGTILLQGLLDQHLPDPLNSGTGIERWRCAQTDLFQGLYRHDDDRKRR
jgi:TetR/AcrR family transcriptional regulator, regulator of cefoperazone and chloramphenicol sensitivity